MCQILSKFLDISSATAWVAQNYLKSSQFYQIQLSEDMRLKENTWNHTGDQKKAKFLKVMNKLIIFKEFINQKKKTNRPVVFSCKCLPNILKYCHHRSDFVKLRKSRFIQTKIEKFSKYAWKFRFWTTTTFFRTTTGTQRKPENPEQSNLFNDVSNQFESYWNIVQFQISSRRKST